MTFKDYVAADLSAVFLNTAEFADTITFQGRPVVAVVSKGSELALAEWHKRNNEPPGVGVELLTLSVMMTDVDRLYANDAVTLDNVEWTVLSTADDAGLRTIHLYRHES